MSAFFLVSLIMFAFFCEHAWATWDRLRASAATSLEIVAREGAAARRVGVAQFVVLLFVGRCGASSICTSAATRSRSSRCSSRSRSASCSSASRSPRCAAPRSRRARSAYLGMVLFGAIGGALRAVQPASRGGPQTIAPVTPTYWAMRGMRLGDPRRPRPRRRHAAHRGAARHGRALHTRCASSLSLRPGESRLGLAQSYSEAAASAGTAGRT